DEHPVRSFSALYRDERDARSSDRQLSGMVNENIRFEAAQVIEVEALAKEVFAKVLWRVEFDGQLLLIIASGVETHVRIQGAKVRVPANVIPVGMRNEDRGQFRQTRRVRPQRFVGGLGRIGSRTGINRDKLLPILRDNEIVFRELKTRKCIHPARYGLGDALRRKSMAALTVFRERSHQHNRFVEVRIAAAP